MTYRILLLFLCLPAVVEAKEVVIPYDDFIVMVSKVEHKDKLLIRNSRWIVGC